MLSVVQKIIVLFTLKVKRHPLLSPNPQNDRKVHGDSCRFGVHFISCHYSPTHPPTRRPILTWFRPPLLQINGTFSLCTALHYVRTDPPVTNRKDRFVSVRWGKVRSYTHVCGEGISNSPPPSQVDRRLNGNGSSSDTVVNRYPQSRV